MNALLAEAFLKTEAAQIACGLPTSSLKLVTQCKAAQTARRLLHSKACHEIQSGTNRPWINCSLNERKKVKETQKEREIQREIENEREKDGGNK